MKEYKLMIGLEVHVQINTKSKLFCGCSTSSSSPNTSVCETCLGFPGSKPRTNKEVINKAIKLGLALNCKINERMFFSRKTYFYPDMSKNYQITQFEKPISEKGYIQIDKKKIRIRRIQIEEDPASLKHEEDYSLIDYNRSGIPLCEVVTEPDFTSSEEVIEFINKLVAILDHIDLYDPKNFSLRADVNISIDGNERVEIKNITGTWAINKAINFEIIRQLALIRTGKKIERHTMHFDIETQKTIPSRSKETEEDYGYIFDPDLPLFTFSKEDIEKIRETLPELPDARISRFIRDYKLSSYEANVLILEKSTADLFEELVKKFEISFVVNWIMGPLRKVLNYNNLKLVQSEVKTSEITNLLTFLKNEKLTPRSAEFVLRELIVRPDDLEKIMKRLKLSDISNKEILNLIEKVISSNQKAVEDYKKGEEKSLNYLIGFVIKETKGQADAKKVRDLLISKIKNSS